MSKKGSPQESYPEQCPPPCRRSLRLVASRVWISLRFGARLAFILVWTWTRFRVSRRYVIVLGEWIRKIVWENFPIFEHPKPGDWLIPHAVSGRRLLHNPQHRNLGLDGENSLSLELHHLPYFSAVSFDALREIDEDGNILTVYNSSRIALEPPTVL